jgi:cytosine/creatinine deaminase
VLAQGIPVAFVHDYVVDPWYRFGSGDMLEVASMGLHVTQMTGQSAVRQCFDAVTLAPAAILGLEGYGIAKDLIEAIRFRATRFRLPDDPQT